MRTFVDSAWARRAAVLDSGFRRKDEATVEPGWESWARRVIGNQLRLLAATRLDSGFRRNDDDAVGARAFFAGMTK
jgi:hypothetical protein